MGAGQTSSANHVELYVPLCGTPQVLVTSTSGRGESPRNTFVLLGARTGPRFTAACEHLITEYALQSVLLYVAQEDLDACDPFLGFAPPLGVAGVDPGLPIIDEEG